MKFLYTILLSVLLLSAVGCSRKVVTQQSHTSLHQDSSNTAIDTSHSSFTETTTETVDYGDILNGSIYLPYGDSSWLRIINSGIIHSDSIESNGIKVKVNLTPVKGGFKANINAVAKPKSVTNTTTKTGTEDKGIATTNSNKKDLDQDSKNKASDKEDELMKWVGLMFLFLAILILAGLFIYLYFKNKQNGNI